LPIDGHFAAMSKPESHAGPLAYCGTLSLRRASNTFPNTHLPRRNQSVSGKS
jgi:hypothetical protein